MNELYWITRLDSFCGVLSIIAILSGIALFIFIFGIVNSIDDEDKEMFRTFKKAFKIALSIFILSIGINIFVPTTKEAYIIYGVGGTIDYIKSDSVASKLPHKAIVALDKYLETISKDNHGNK